MTLSSLTATGLDPTAGIISNTTHRDINEIHDSKAIFARSQRSLYVVVPGAEMVLP
jgi:hypothetical protein